MRVKKDVGAFQVAMNYFAFMHVVHPRCNSIGNFEGLEIFALKQTTTQRNKQVKRTRFVENNLGNLKQSSDQTRNRCGETSLVRPPKTKKCHKLFGNGCTVRAGSGSAAEIAVMLGVYVVSGFTLGFCRSPMNNVNMCPGASQKGCLSRKFSSVS